MLSDQQNLDSLHDCDATPAILAPQLLLGDLQRLDHTLTDRVLAQSIARAVETDGEILCQISREEAEACSDRAIAQLMSGRTASTSVDNPQLSPEEIPDIVLAKFAGMYNSKQLGDILHSRAVPQKRGNAAESSSIAESSTKMRRGQVSEQDEERPITVECTICGEDKRQFDSITVPCGHDYCIGCIRELFTQSMTDESLFPPRCCRQPIDFSEVRIFFPKALKDEFSLKQIEFNAPNRTYCAQKSCSAFILPKDIVADTGTCSACASKTCNICKDDAHDGDCPQDDSLQQTLALAADQGWQRCRTCLSMIELDFGCNHMRRVFEYSFE